METRANLIQIGLFVFAVILAGFAGAFWLLKGDQRGPRATIAIGFHGTVGGLLPGAAVSFNGIKIGEVSKVQFAGDEPNHVVAYLAVDANAPIRQDSSVALGFSGLTGYATVQITGGSLASPRLLDQKGGIPELNADANSVQDLMQGAKTTLGRANETLDTVNKVVQETAPSVTRIIKNVETVSDSLATNAPNIDKFLKSVGSAADTLNAVSARIDKLTTDLDAIATAVDRDQVAKIIANAAKVSDQVAASTAHLQDVATDLQATVSDVRKVVAAIDPVKISSAIDQVNKISTYVGSKTGEFDDLLKNARAASANINTVSAAVADRSNELKQFMTDASGAMKQVEIASHRFDPILAKIDGIVGSDAGQGLFAQGKSFLVEATEAAKAFKDTSVIYGSKANDITAAIKDFVTESRKTLVTIDRAVANFDRNPQQLLFGSKDSVPEYGPGRR